MKTYNIQYISKEDFSSIINSKGTDKESQSILIQIFSGNIDISFLKDLAHYIRSHFPKAVIIGATTDGEILATKITANKTIISITEFEKSTLNSCYLEKKDDSFSLGAEVAKSLCEKDTKVLITFTDGLNVNGEEYLCGLETVNKDMVIAGGLAGDNGSFKFTYIIHDDKVYESGAVGVAISSKSLRASNRYSFEWESIGKEFVVEESEGNLVKKIAGLTPRDLYRKYLGEYGASLLPGIGAEFPLIVTHEGVELARAVMKLNDDGSLVFAGNIHQGSKVRFGIGNAEKILKKSADLYNNIVYEWDAIFIYSCVARRKFLDSKAGAEVKHFSNIAPVAGFFTYGEFLKNPDKPSLFFNETMTVLLLSEDEEFTELHSKIEIKAERFTTIEALSHLVNEITKENTAINESLEKRVNEQTKELALKNKELEKELYTDSLTGLGNRNSLLENIKKYAPEGIMLVDINSFNTINDLYGEQVGNLVLQSFGEFLLDETENSCHIHRLSADTFALLNTQHHELGYCKYMATKILDSIERRNISFKVDEVNLDFTISIKISLARLEHGENLLENADMALKYAKKNGENFVVYNPNLKIEELYEKDLKIVKMVKDALDEDRVVPFYQPIIKGDKITYECLVRILNKDRVISPYEFLEVIKSTKYYPEITKIVIRKSFETFKNIDASFSINFSYNDIKNKDTVSYLKEMIEKYDASKKLVLEIVESESFENYDLVAKFLKVFQDMGVRIAIDDFGSGYSNFSHLIQLNPDYIKIDGSLIKDLAIDNKSFTITKSIVNFAKDMNIKTVAEYIHNIDVYEKAKSLEIDGFQGFYFGEPIDRLASPLKKK